MVECDISGGNEIVLDGIEPYSLYGFFSTGSAKSSRASSNLIETKGTSLYYADANASSSMSFNLGNLGKVKIIRFLPENEHLSMDTNTEHPLGIIDNYEVFEKFFLCDLAKVDDKSNVTPFKPFNRKREWKK